MIRSFTDIVAWQFGHKLALIIYSVTSNFPQSEQFGLVSQMRRASVSVTSNIAEGFGRQTEKDREHFYTMASGSLYELKSQVLLAKDLKFLDDQTSADLMNQLDETHKLLNGLLKVHRMGKSNV